MYYHRFFQIQDDIAMMADRCIHRCENQPLAGPDPASSLRLL